MIDEAYVLKNQYTIDKKFNPHYAGNDTKIAKKQTKASSKTANIKKEAKNWEKPPTIVAKRNARERTRVHTVNQAFVILKHRLPSLRSHTKRVSKLKILRAAIAYIDDMIDLLKSSDIQPILTPVHWPIGKRASKSQANNENKHAAVAHGSADQPLSSNSQSISTLNHASTYIKPLIEYPAYLYPAQAAQAYPYTTSTTSQLAAATYSTQPPHAIFVGNGFIIPQGY